MKEKVLHTRVPEELYEKISDKAKKHRTTVSSLIRNVVEDGLDIYSDVSDIVDDKIRQRLKNKDKNKDEIIGFQKIRLVKKQRCNNCETELKKGTEVNLEIYQNSSKKTIRCLECKKF